MSGDVKRCRGIYVANRNPRSTNGVDEIGAQVALRGTVFPPTADLGGLFGRWAPFPICHVKSPQDGLTLLCCSFRARKSVTIPTKVIPAPLNIPITSDLFSN